MACFRVLTGAVLGAVVLFSAGCVDTSWRAYGHDTRLFSQQPNESDAQRVNRLNSRFSSAPWLGFHDSWWRLIYGIPGCLWQCRVHWVSRWTVLRDLRDRIQPGNDPLAIPTPRCHPARRLRYHHRPVADCCGKRQPFRPRNRFKRRHRGQCCGAHSSHLRRSGPQL